MKELERRALMGDKEAQKLCTEQGIVLPCPFCGGHGKVSFKDHLFVGQNVFGDKKLVYRIQVICNKCRSRGKPVFTEPLVNPNPYITKWGNNYAETETCKKETERFLPYALSAIFKWNTRSAPPVIHARWIDHGSFVTCSHCGEEQYGTDTGRIYCQNCGAKMDEEDKTNEPKT